MPGLRASRHLRLLQPRCSSACRAPARGDQTRQSAPASRVTPRGDGNTARIAPFGPGCPLLYPIFYTDSAKHVRPDGDGQKQKLCTLREGKIEQPHATQLALEKSEVDRQP